MAMVRFTDFRSMADDQQSEAIKEFRVGLVQLHRGQAAEAVEALRRAVTLEPRNPYFLSYYGLAVGMARRQWDEAEALCIDALRIKRNLPQLYLNLADVYRRAGRRADAVETLSEGLGYTGQDARLANALERYGLRRRPVVSFLGRDNPINRCLGRLRHATREMLHRHSGPA
jgi:Flp pilus assembly protein TadD